MMSLAGTCTYAGFVGLPPVTPGVCCGSSWSESKTGELPSYH